MKTIFCRTSLAALLTTSSIVCAQNVSSPRARPQYTVIDLGPLGGPPGQPFVIKNNGLISGAAAVSATVWHAVLWYMGSQFDIGTSGLNSAGFGNNEQGQVVGQTETPA